MINEAKRKMTMNTFDQLIRLGIAVYLDYKKRGYDDFKAEEKALAEVHEVSQEYTNVRL